MSKMGAITFVGNSGNRYEFTLYPLDARFKAGYGGVYFVTSRHDQEHAHHSHHNIFGGETDDLSSVLSDHPKQALFETEQANCVAVHATRNAPARARILAELVEKYSPPGNMA
jgi:hypothetical protein